MKSIESYEEAAEKRSKVERDNRLSATVLGYHRERLASAPKPRGEFETWLDDLPARISMVQVVRQSSKRRQEYVQHFETATAYREADPDVAAVRLLSIEDLLDSAVPGVPSFRIEKRHLRGGGRSRAYVGTAVAVGATLFLFVLNSAAEDNLEGLSEDQAGNAFTATVQTAVRRLCYRIWAEDVASRLWVHFPDKSRLARDDRHAINLVDTLAWGDVILRIAGDSYPKLDQQAKMVLQIMLSVSAQELESIVNRLFGTRFGILRAGRWLGQEAPPITHELATEVRDDGVQTWEERDVHQLVPRDNATAMMHGLVDAALESAGDKTDRGPAGFNDHPRAIPDWKRVANVAGTELGVQSRDWVHIDRGGLAVHKLSKGGSVSLRKYLEPRWIEGWRTGRTPVEVAIPKVIASSFDVQLTDYQCWVERADGTVAVRTLQEMPLPPLDCDDTDCQRDGHLDGGRRHLTHGFGIPDWKWDRFEQLLERTSRRKGERPPGTDGLRHPFAESFFWDDDGRQYKLRAVQRANHGSGYSLYGRDAGSNSARGWTYGVDETCLASVVGSTFNRALGEDLERLLGDITQELVPLTVAEPARNDDQDEDDSVARAEQALAEAQESLDAADNKLKATRRVVLLAKAQFEASNSEPYVDPDTVEEAREQLAVAEGMLTEDKAARSEAAASVQRCQAQVATAGEGTEPAADQRSATVDLSEHLVVAKALQKADGAVSRALNDCVRQILDETSRIEIDDDDHRRIIVRPTWQFVAADTEEVLTYQRTVHVERLRANPKTKTKVVDVAQRNQRTIPRLLLRDGLSRTEVGNRFGIQFDPGDSKAYGLQIVRSWLEDHGVTRKLEHALLDAAPIVRRCLYYKLTGDQGEIDTLIAEQGISEGWPDLIVDRYTARKIVTRDSWPATWVASDHVIDRRVVDAIVARGGRATIGELAADTGLSLEQVARTAHVVPDSQRHLSTPKFAQPPILMKGEWRSRSPAPLAEREVWLLECPHDCDGFVNHPLWTPETDPPRDAMYPFAALCPKCRRTPWGPEVYPVDYLRCWKGPIGRSGCRDSRKTTTLAAAPHIPPVASARSTSTHRATMSGPARQLAADAASLRQPRSV